jgi:hypothetical protein
VDKNGIVQWSGKHQRADEMSDFKEGISLVAAH